jgi:hypothetical protein
MFNPFGENSHTSYTCLTCFLEFQTTGGLTQHTNSAHQQFTLQSDNNVLLVYQYHPHLTGKHVLKLYNDVLTMRVAKPCNVHGEFLPLYTCPPAPRSEEDPWSLFESQTDFNFAYYHFIEVQNLAILIDKALDMWVSQVAEFHGRVPWKNTKELYATIDDIQCSHSPWVVYKIRYQGPLPPGPPPKWMMQTYELCARDTCKVLHHQLESTHFKDKINLTPYRQFDESGQCIWSNVMSADWAWTQVVCCKDGYAFIVLIWEYI